MYVVIDCYEGEAEIVGRAETVEQAKQIESAELKPLSRQNR